MATGQKAWVRSWGRVILGYIEKIMEKKVELLFRVWGFRVLGFRIRELA